MDETAPPFILGAINVTLGGAGDADFILYSGANVSLGVGGVNDSINATFEAASGVRTRVWFPLLFLLPTLSGIFGNVLVIIAVSKEPQLQNVTNYFLLSLAFADFLVSVVVMPLTMFTEIVGHWPFGDGVCNFYVTMDVLLCTSSIMHMVMISVDRFLGIKYPLKTRNRSKKAVVPKIVFCWLISSGICCPITILGIVDKRNIFVGDPALRTCAINNAHFQIYGSFFAFYIPLAAMMTCYVLTVRLLNDQAKFCQAAKFGKRDNAALAAAVATRNSSSSSSSSSSARKNKNARRRSISDTVIHFANRGTHRNDDDYGTLRTSRRPVPSPRPPDTPSVMLLGRRSSPPPPLAATRTPPQHSLSRAPPSPSPLSPPITAAASCLRSPRRFVTQQSEPDAMTMRLIHSSSSAQSISQLQDDAAAAAVELSFKRENLISRKTFFFSKLNINQVANEQKATKVLGIVFMLFILFWAPFFILNTIHGICMKFSEDCFEIPEIVFKVFLWLGYLSSTINPLIYTVFNNIFRRTFNRLLRCDCRVNKYSRKNPRAQFLSHKTNFRTSYFSCSNSGSETRM